MAKTMTDDGRRHGTGSGWLPPATPPPPVPKWTGSRAYPAVVRETSTFAMGAIVASDRKEFAHMSPWGAWDYRPEPDSDADIDQAIMGKINIGIRAIPLLATTEVVVAEPEIVDLIPEWESDEQFAAFFKSFALPRSPMFLDLESDAGLPTSWEVGTWPLPFHLRAAIVWEQDEVVYVIPFGSVGGVHLLGGNDYQAWARWCFPRRGAEVAIGAGDFALTLGGEFTSWVYPDEDSACMHMGAIAYNLSLRVFSALFAIEARGGGLDELPLPRQQRRRAQRKGEQIALVPAGFPEPGPLREENLPLAEEGGECVVPQTHRRLEQAHAHWHQALEAYGDPDLFTTHLNGLITAMRSVTLVMKKEFGNSEEFQAWYDHCVDEMKADRWMTWLVKARNTVEKEGDLDTASKAVVRVLGPWQSRVLEKEVDPTLTAAEISRSLSLPSLAPEVRENGTLEVERRWTLPDLDGEEILDVLAHDLGVLTRVVGEAHRQRGGKIGDCELTLGRACGDQTVPTHPSGKPSCMLGSKAARTRHRNLSNGTPYGLEVIRHEYDRAAIDLNELKERYDAVTGLGPSRDDPLMKQAADLHQVARGIMEADGYHVAVAFLYRGKEQIGRLPMQPEDDRDKHMMLRAVYAEADQLSADGLVFTTESWFAQELPEDDPSHALRPSEREDRAEGLVTYCLERGGDRRTWFSLVERDGNELRFHEVAVDTLGIPPVFQPMLDIWEGWQTGASET